MIPRKTLIRGFSTDTKPVGVIPGTLFFELDTGKTYTWNGSNWSELGGAVSTNTILKQLVEYSKLYYLEEKWDYDISSGVTFKSGTGSIVPQGSFLYLTTGGTASSYAVVHRYFSGSNPSWGYERYTVYKVAFSANTNQIVWLMSGNSFTTKDASSYTGVHVGFKVVDGNLYATVADGTTEAEQLLQSITALQEYTLEYHYIPDNSVEFYVNGELLATITNNLPPSDSTDASALLAGSFSIYNTADETKELLVYSVKSVVLEG